MDWEDEQNSDLVFHIAQLYNRGGGDAVRAAFALSRLREGAMPFNRRPTPARLRRAARRIDIVRVEGPARRLQDSFGGVEGDIAAEQALLYQGGLIYRAGRAAFDGSGEGRIRAPEVD